MKVLVCGGRGFTDAAQVCDVLDALHADTSIRRVIHGAALGADTHAARWAQSRGVEVIPCPAAWGVHGRAAGPIRNQQMLREAPDLVVAFAGGRGTADMVARAELAGVSVMRVSPRVRGSGKQ